MFRAVGCNQITFPATRSTAWIKLWIDVTDMVSRSRVQPFFSGRVDQTRESGGNRAYILLPRKLEPGWQKLGSHVTNCRENVSRTYFDLPCDRSLHPMWQTVMIDTFFAFWSFLVAEHIFNFRFQRPCYNRGPHPKYSIRWSLSRLELQASRGPAVIFEFWVILTYVYDLLGDRHLNDVIFFSVLYKTSRFLVAVCLLSNSHRGVDHRKHQNVVRTSKAHLAIALCAGFFCS